MFSIDIRGKTPIYEQLLNRITELISSGAMSENERMPTVREVAKDLGVNPNTVQKAYQMLEQRGLIYSIPAKGSYVAKSDTVINTVKEQALARFRESALNAINSGLEPNVLKTEIEKLEGGTKND